MLNENIKKYRKLKGYTQETFAQELNVVRQTVSKWEKGYSVPDAVMLEKIAELFEISVSELLGGSQEINEDSPGLSQVAKQLSILNNQIAKKELARKRRNKRIVLIILAVITASILITGIFFSLFSFKRSETVLICGESDGAAVQADIDTELDKAVSEAVISNNSSSYLQGECKTESHFVFDVKEHGSTVTVYLIEKYSEFGFVNGFFTDISGGSTPAAFTFKKNADGYELTESQYPQDGTLYAPSVKEIFPADIAATVMTGLSQEQCEKMWETQVRQAQAYLASIDRQTVVCRYSDIHTEFLTDHGIDNEVCNKITGRFPGYDYTIANHEKIENGKRYVYQTEYDETNGWVTLTKFEYDTDKIIEFTAIDGKTGEIVKAAGIPERVRYKTGRTDIFNRTTADFN